MYNYLEKIKAEFVFLNAMKLIIRKNFFHIKRHDFKSVKLHDQPAHVLAHSFRVSTLKLNEAMTRNLIVRWS